VSKTGEVFFDTDDGVVRIEALSQGTVSLMGWVGYLVRRIYDKYSHHDQPTHGYALVLIDEIDAHMHPGWQQALVSNLKSIFPNAQVIATTHSPLIPITCDQGEVFLVKRNKLEGGRIQIVRTDIDFRQWRADQVLTSSLFGLESSRDPSLFKLFEEYTDLITREQLSEEDQKRLSYLASRLAVRPPQPFEREEARTAFKSIEDALDEKIAAIPAEKKEKVKREVKAQLLESITRSRRPQ
jgi:predicted ATP-binding protein involved in virulence